MFFSGTPSLSPFTRRRSEAEGALWRAEGVLSAYGGRSPKAGV